MSKTAFFAQTISAVSVQIFTGFSVVPVTVYTGVHAVLAVRFTSAAPKACSSAIIEVAATRSSPNPEMITWYSSGSFNGFDVNTGCRFIPFFA